MNTKDKQALKKWDRFREAIHNTTSIDPTDGYEQIEARKKRLEKNEEAWYQYYFPHWFSNNFSPYHKRWWKATNNPKYRKLGLKAYRGFSKTTTTQAKLIRKALLKEFNYMIYVSKSGDAAEGMIEPIKIQFEENKRLIQDYNNQVKLGSWESHRIILKNGTGFQAVGRGQSPRGLKIGAQRPDLIVIDDLDDDEIIRSAEQLDKFWDWLTGALIPAMDFSGNYAAWFLQNLYAEDCLMARWCEIADYVLEVNILDKKGNPTWPDRFPKQVVNDILKGIPEHIKQREYFNNPIKPGSVFKKEWIQWKKMPPLSQYKYLVSYLDPSFSNKKFADHKAWPLIGLWKGEIHIRKSFCDLASVQEMVLWGYELDRYVKSRGGSAIHWMEEVFLQSLLYKDFAEQAAKEGYHLGLRGDQRKKPHKDMRIAAQAGKFERGVVYFDIAEKSNHHMQNLVDQFLLFQMGSTKVKKDGPDAVEGGIVKLEEMVFQSEKPIVGKRSPNPKRF